MRSILRVLVAVAFFVACEMSGADLGLTSVALAEGDSDGDGIDDAVDACPEEAEDFDGFEDEDGCPEDASAPLCADVTGDNRVTWWDYLLVRRRRGTEEGDRRYDEIYDLNKDGRIDSLDVAIVREQIGQTCLLAVGEPCSASEDCIPAAVCDESVNECRLPVGASCSETSYCVSDAICDESLNECRLPVGGYCETAADCTPPAVCDASLNECRLPVGESCSDTSECVSGASCDGITYACQLMADGLTALHTRYLGLFSGPGRQPLDLDLAQNMGGTDLGISYEANGRINFIFGDTFNFFDESPPIYTYGPCCSDSAGWIDAMEPVPEPYAAPMVNFYTGVSAYNPGWWSPVEIGDSPVGPVSLGGMEVPSGALVLPSGDQYILFTSGWDEAFQTHTRLAVGRVPYGQTGPCPVSGECILDYVWHRDSVRFSATTPILDEAENVIWMFGTGPYRQDTAYLARVPIDAIEDPDSWEYFQGFADGAPVFNMGTPDDAVALFDENCMGEASVLYHQGLNKYVMTYNCYLGQNAPDGILLRVADQPYGPWSHPITLMQQSDPWGKYVHRPTCIDLPQGPCVSEDDGISNPFAEYQWGGIYGPFLIPQWFEDDSESGLYSIIYTLSSFNPYQVYLVKTVLGEPGATYTPPSREPDPPDPLDNPDWSAGTAGWTQVYGGMFYPYPMPSEMTLTTYGMDGTGPANFGMLAQSFRVDPGVTSLRFNVTGGHSQIQLWHNGSLYRLSRGRDSNEIVVPVRWNIEEFQGRTMEIRIVDNEFDPEDAWGFVTVGELHLE